MTIPPKFKAFEGKLKYIIGVVGSIIIIWNGIVYTYNKLEPTINFVKDGSAIVDTLYSRVTELEKQLEIKELIEVMTVLVGVVAADLPYVDEHTYYLYWRGEKIIGRLKRTSSGNVYAFVTDRYVGERPFFASYDFDKKYYTLTDFQGSHTPIYKEE